MTYSLKNTLVFLSAALFAIVLMPLAAYAQTPSTNDNNRDNSWAHVNQLTQEVGETELEFVNPRGFASCFEYRTDGDTSQVVATNGGDNFNPAITDGLYPYTCLVNNSSSILIEADEYVEVRMVFGAEEDERFDWTRFDVLEAPFVRSAEITAPEAGEEVTGVVDFAATLIDEDEDDTVQWAVRAGTCAKGTNTVAGNVDGFSSDYDWDNVNFTASVDMSLLPVGDYCFIFNPSESSGDASIRLTQEFVLTYPDPEEKMQCMKSGWEDYGFQNQGQCVRYIETGKDSR